MQDAPAEGSSTSRKRGRPRKTAIAQGVSQASASQPVATTIPFGADIVEVEDDDDEAVLDLIDPSENGSIELDSIAAQICSGEALQASEE